MKQSSSLFLFFFCMISNSFLFSKPLDNSSQPAEPETLKTRTWSNYLNPKNYLDDYHRRRAEKYVGEKPPWIQMPCCKDGRYLQLNLDPWIFACATTVKILYQTFNTMARTGTKFENIKVSVFRPGVAGTISKWGPFLQHISLYGCCNKIVILKILKKNLNKKIVHF